MATPYAGPRKKARREECLGYEIRGWWAEEKADGCYVELHVGFDGRYTRIVELVYRSGATVGRAAGCDLLGQRVNLAAGTVIAGELMVRTPAAARWQAEHGGVTGMVAFDLLAEGEHHAKEAARAAWPCATMERWPARDWTTAPMVWRRARLEQLVAELDGPAARKIHLVEQRRYNLRPFFDEVVDRGGEGLVLKDPGAPVGEGMRKLKRHDTIDARVVQRIPGEGVVTLDWGGRQFTVSSPSFTTHTGDVVEVAHMGFYDAETWTPRHARIVGIREDLMLQ